MAARSACPNPLQCAAVQFGRIRTDRALILRGPWLLNGVVSGGTLIKQGLGTLFLNGANTYASTVITGGAVLGNSTSIRGNVDFQPAPNGGPLQVTFEQTADGTFAGAITGRLAQQDGCGVAHPNWREHLFGRHQGSGRNPHRHVEQPAGRHREQRRGRLQPEPRRDLCRQSDGLRHAGQERRRPPLDHRTRSGWRRHDHQRRDARGERHADQQCHHQQGRYACRQQ